MKTYKQQDLRTFLWPTAHLHLAVQTLARRSGFAQNEETPPPFPADETVENTSLFGQWTELAAARLKIDIIPSEWQYSETAEMLRCVGPALLRLPAAGKDEPQFLAVLKGGRRHLTVLTPERKKCRIQQAAVRDALTRSLREKAARPAACLLQQAGIAEERGQDSLNAIVDEQLSSLPMYGCWLLRLSPGSEFKQQLRHAHIPLTLAGIGAAYLGVQFLTIVSWWFIGRQALAGHFTYAAVTAWALLLLSVIPFQLLDRWLQSLLSLKIGELFKQRLLCGILQLEPEEIRHQGAGQFMGIIMEAESLSTLALEGGAAALLSLLQLCTAAVILSMGTGGLLHALLLVFWSGLIGWLCLKYYRYSQQWITSYRNMNNDMTEGMIGYRTRLAQESMVHWHDREEKILRGYVDISQKFDTISIVIQGAAGRGWYIVGLTGIIQTFLFGKGDTNLMAVSVAGILLAAQSLSQFISGVTSTVNAMTGWKQVRPLFQAAVRSMRKTAHILPNVLDQAAASKKHPTVFVQDMVFRYPRATSPVLTGCSEYISPTDRILLQGPSGGGKSTLAALLTGLRFPESGQLQLHGMQHDIVGPKLWRTRVVSSPQFHENHVLTETFAFNLLMGRSWPPQPDDFQAAVQICEELGLGELLQRLPAGFQQMVGESGWRLSHGERSRLYIARALLQHADLIILDESFAALDPENFELALDCVLRRVPALVVIAHP
ncbi:ABC-type multidrug transport system, ATPase and permease component [Candidatus Electrothrix gigas]